MGLVFLVVLGGILGWLAAIILDAEDRRDLTLNLIAGVAGSTVTGLVVSPMVGGGTLLNDTYSVSALMLALVGALAAIAGANLFRHVQLR
jgi:uncharacterized membrane protein YeaQ/YmgE (transglycosylase-associated protein family)